MIHERVPSSTPLKKVPCLSAKMTYQTWQTFLQADQHVMSPGVMSRVTLESPPEAAIEATPDSTPYATPIKVF